MLVADYRVWQSRLIQIQSMASQVEGDFQAFYGVAISDIFGLLGTIRHRLPPSFQVQLDWEVSEIPAGALNIEGLYGGVVNLALLPLQGDETAYCIWELANDARSAAAEIPRRARLNIAANTKSLINRLQVEWQNRNEGMAPAPAVPDFAEFYANIATGGDDTTDEGRACSHARTATNYRQADGTKASQSPRPRPPSS